MVHCWLAGYMSAYWRGIIGCDFIYAIYLTNIFICKGIYGGTAGMFWPLLFAWIAALPSNAITTIENF
jgi:hypothetical protein